MIALRYFILTIFLLLFGYTVMSQEIVDSTKVWANMQEHCLEWGSRYSTDHHKFYGDTIINDTVYKKVWISEDELNEEWNFFGSFIREENGRVYYREMFLNEGLIYDFNMQVGDSVLINNTRAVQGLWLTLTEIDTIESYGGSIERWKLENATYLNAEYWMRGIGSVTGVLNSGSNVFGGLCGLFTLLCSKHNNEIIYQDTIYQTCHYELISDIEEEKQNIENPFRLLNSKSSNQFELKFEDESEKLITIVSIDGRIVYTNKTRDPNLIISKSIFKQGLYVINCLMDGQSYTVKILK